MPRRPYVKKESSMFPWKKRTNEEIRDLKVAVLNLLESGEAKTLTKAAEILELRPSVVWHWRETDEDFKSCANLVKQVLADRYEEDLGKSTNIVAKIFLLKGLRPEKYRDNYRAIIVDTNTAEAIKELRRLGEKVAEVIEVETDAEPATKGVHLPEATIFSLP